MASSNFLNDLDKPLNIQSFLGKGFDELANLASQFSPRGTLSSLQSNKNDLWFEDQELFLKTIRNNYPILYKAISKIEDCIVSQGKELNEMPTLYDLLIDSIPLDVRRMFCWQQLNRHKLDDDNTFQDLPHFSHPELVQIYGLQIDLTYTYFLEKGRPFEAYLSIVNSTGFPIPGEKVHKLCKKAIKLAFDSPSNTEIAAACVTFLQFFRQDTTTFRLHLAVGYLIITYSAKFLGLEEKSQSCELGRLLKRALFDKEDRAVKHLIELVSTSYGQKYSNKGCSVDELVAYQIAIDFCKLYKIDLPVSFLNKCLELGDWLTFTVFAQYYEYPREVIIKQLASFSGCIPEHLEKAFSSPMVTSERVGAQPIIGRRVTESRDTLYTRLGLVKSMAIRKSSSPSNLQTSNNYLATSAEDDRSSVMSEDVETASIASSSMTVDFASGIELDADNPPKDFFNLVLVCQKSYPTQPSKSLLASSIILNNPIPALIAASLPVFTNEFEPPYSSFDCFCCWLFASFDMPVKNRRLTDESNQIIIWSQSELTTLLQSALLISNNYIVLKNGLYLFSRGESPLLFLTDFLIDYLVEKDYHNSITKLEQFKECLETLRRPLVCGDVLSQKSWIEQTCATIICASLEATDSLYELNILLSHLDFLKISNYFASNQVQLPDFRKMYRLTQCIKDTGILFNLSEIFSALSSKNDDESAINLIHILQSKNYFTEAHQAANILDVDSKKVFLNEWTIKVSKRVNSLRTWKECIVALEKNVPNSCAIDDFVKKFINESTLTSSYAHVYLLTKQLDYSFKLLVNREEFNRIEALLWSKVMSEVVMNKNTPEFSEVTLNKKVTECPEWNSVWNSIINVYEANWCELGELEDDFQLFRDKLIDNTMMKTVDPSIVIGRMLNDGKIDLANRVAKMFDFRNLDLELANFCHKLAESAMIKEAAKIYLSSRVHEYDMTELNEVVMLLNQLDLKKSSDVIKILEKCESLTTDANRACRRIVLLYKISFIIDSSYSKLWRESSNALILQKLIRILVKNPEAFALARELIIFSKIDDIKVSKIIISETVGLLHQQIEESNSLSSSTISFISAKNDASFLSLIRLVNDPSKLGRQFLEILKDQGIAPMMAVEICIKSHECFSLSCDIEGISSVLRNARLIVTHHLVPTKNHQSMIRLLVGIGRYSEMSYIFDLLRDNHQFELLLKKGFHKSNQLRIALLDYLKGDKDMYPLIALNFSMHREIAEMLEKSARKTLCCINLRRSQNTMSFKHDLENVMQEFMDASESYKKAGVFSRSDLCEKMAQLIALQINFLPLGNVVINLPDSVLIEFITKHSKFVEALIVADAYQNHRHWNMAIFQNVVLRGDLVYLREYRTTLPLTAHNMEEIFIIYSKWKTTNSKSTPSETFTTVKGNFHKLLKTFDDLVLTHKYFQELGFVEAANNLVRNVDGAYLRDLKRQGNLPS